MSPRKPPRKGGGALGLYLLVAVLAAAVGFLAAYVLQEGRHGPREEDQPQREHRAKPDPRESLEALLGGPLDLSGTRVEVARKAEAQELLGKLERVAKKYPKKVAVLEPHWGRDRLAATLRVSPDEYPLEVRWPSPRETSPPKERAAPREEGGPRVSLVIDDMGADLQRARAFLDLDAQITPAIIPGLSVSLETAHLARERGRAFLVHLPMEPQGYPKVNPGKGALLQTMGEPEFRRRVGEALASLPGAAGLNNHMGSRLTELERPMEWTMDELRRNNLFFLDSMTTPKSVAGAAARSAGIGWARRDVFLDNEESVSAIRTQLDRAMDKAKQNGSAIAIGHPHPSTLQAITEWVPRARAEGVIFVPLGDLIRRPEG